MVFTSRDVLRTFAYDAGERAIKTGAQVAAAAMAAGATFGDVDWAVVGPMIAYAMALSVLTSIGSFNSAQPGTASLVGVGPVGKHAKREE